MQSLLTFGGLTVLRRVVEALPQYDCLYLGDNARAALIARGFAEMLLRGARVDLTGLDPQARHVIWERLRQLIARRRRATPRSAGRARSRRGSRGPASPRARGCRASGRRRRR